MTTYAKALAASRAKDASRKDCEYCGRPMADDEDGALFDAVSSAGGERPELCWLPGRGDCQGMMDLCHAVESARNDGWSLANVQAAVLRAWGGK